MELVIFIEMTDSRIFALIISVNFLVSKKKREKRELTSEDEKIQYRGCVKKEINLMKIIES